MAHRFEVLTTAQQWEQIRPICEKLNRTLPAEDSGAVIAEFDEVGEIIAFETLVNAVFVEMVWARDGHTNLRALWNKGLAFLRRFTGERERQQLVTFTADDETGERIAHALEGLGCERLNWTIYRREL